MIAALFVCLAACAAPRPPELPISVAARSGIVHASSSEKARAFADVLDDLAPRIASVLPGCASRPVDVRLVPKLARENWGGATFTLPDMRWIELPEGEDPKAIAATLVHELVHYGSLSHTLSALEVMPPVPSAL